VAPSLIHILAKSTRKEFVLPALQHSLCHKIYVINFQIVAYKTSEKSHSKSRNNYGCSVVIGEALRKN